MPRCVLLMNLYHCNSNSLTNCGKDRVKSQGRGMRRGKPEASLVQERLLGSPTAAQGQRDSSAHSCLEFLVEAPITCPPTPHTLVPQELSFRLGFMPIEIQTYHLSF